MVLASLQRGWPLALLVGIGGILYLSHTPNTYQAIPPFFFLFPALYPRRLISLDPNTQTPRPSGRPHSDTRGRDEWEVRRFIPRPSLPHPHSVVTAFYLYLLSAPLQRVPAFYRLWQQPSLPAAPQAFRCDSSPPMPHHPVLVSLALLTAPQGPIHTPSTAEL